VHRLHPPDIGGISLQAEALSRMQASMGHDIVVFTSAQEGMPRHEFRSGYEIYRFPPLGHPLENPLVVTMIPTLMAIDLRRVDIVHAHSHLFFSTNLAALKRKISSTPLVITNHGFKVQRGLWMDLFQDAYLASAGRWTLRAADKVISLEGDGARRVCSMGVHPSKSIVIPNGVDIDLFRPKRDRTVDNSILWAGRFVEEKGVKYLLEAVRSISKKMPSIRLSLAGYGPLEDRLKSYTQQLDISGNVKFIGPVDHKTLASLMNECAIFALPNLGVELSSVMLEAMACARPFVATDGAAIKDEVGGAGMFVPPKDSESLAKAIMHLLSDEALRTRLGQRGRSIVVERFSWRRVAQAHTDLFQHLTRQ